VHKVAGEAVARARRGEGPTLIELKTYRYTGHAISNPICAIGRPDEEIAAWKARDPIPYLEEYLLRRNLAAAPDLQAIQDGAKARVAAAEAFAEASPRPRPETALEDVYTEWPAGVPL
jgi:acetoin:2,6-dichlorophenolindophenol oxidoreductase subunit alpha